MNLMTLSTPQQQIELFHLLFLRHLGERIDKQHYVLKGGCNLRFYFKSIRYSEDIDLDVRIIAKDTLKSQVNRVLSATPFQQVLKAHNLAIQDVNAVKQTDTTQRWKLKIQGPATSLLVPTKIEFSRRIMTGDFLFEPVDSEIVASYNLYPILGNHYSRSSALNQKIEALIHRTETQARDVFDIVHLLDLGAKFEMSSNKIKSKMDQATENAMSISYVDYKAQVVSFLKSEYRDFYGTEKKWNEMQERLVNLFQNFGN